MRKIVALNHVRRTNVKTAAATNWIWSKLQLNRLIRYVDDFALFSDDREFLAEAKLAMEEYLASLRLKLHPSKSQLFETRHGANFLGFCILPDRIRVRTENLRRAKRRLKRLKAEYEEGKIELEQISHSIRSWIAHLKHGDTWRLRTKIFEDFVL